MTEFDSRKDDQAHDDFVRWIQNNPQAYVINNKGRNSVLHRATCSQFLPYEGVNQSNNPKVCALDKRQLEDWADKQENLDLVPCQICM
jgi:hypothetical protein